MHDEKIKRQDLEAIQTTSNKQWCYLHFGWSCSEGQYLTWSNVLWRRILPDTGAPNSLWEEPLWDILGPAPIIKGDWQLYYHGLRIGDGTLSHRQSSLCKCINGRKQMYHKYIKVQLKCITNVSTVNWGQGHQRIREMRIEGRLGVGREHGCVCMCGKLVHIDCNEVLGRVVTFTLLRRLLMLEKGRRRQMLSNGHQRGWED